MNKYGSNTYSTSTSTSTSSSAYTAGYTTNQSALWGICGGCGGKSILDNRGLCNICADIIPTHIPWKQHKRYRDRIVLGKLPNN